MRRTLCLAWLALHFCLIFAGSVRETLGLIARGLTVVPRRFAACADAGEAIAATLLGEKLPLSSALRQGISTYLNFAGIDRGYGYFAPNVPASYKLVFELYYPDGRVEYQLPRANSRAARLRVAGLLDEIARTRNEPLRERLVRTLAESAWQGHPGITKLRAIFGAILLPTSDGFERGERQRYEFLYAYEFSRRE